MLISKYNLRDAGMFHETPGVNGTPVVPPVTPPTVPPTETVEEPFDRERAMATIANLRKFEKDAKRLQAEVDAAKKAEDDRKAAEMTEVQKSEKKAVDAQAALDSFKTRHRTTVIYGAVRLAAVAAGFIDSEDAIKLADLSAVELADDDTVTGAKQAVEKLARDKPHLIAATRPTAPNINATGGGNPPPITPEAIVEQKRLSGQYVPY